MITGLRNNEYLKEFFDTPTEMMESTGLSIEVCKKIMYGQAFQPLIIHLQALIKSGVDLNEYLNIQVQV